MADRQALGIDIAQYARTGGINFDRVKAFIEAGTFDFLIIKAALGLNKNVIFDEQINGAEQRGIPYSTYYFLDPLQDIEDQAQHYVDLVGSQQPQYIVDVEKPHDESRVPNKNELQRFINRLANLTGKKPIIYSRESILSSIGFLSEAKQYKLWIAQYYYVWGWSTTFPFIKRLYNFFDEFIKDHEWKVPEDFAGTELEENVVLWQFTKKGDGQHYIFNPTTRDPDNPIGKKSADLNISIAKREEFMEFMFAGAPLIGDGDDGGGGGGGGVTPSPGSPYPGKTNQDMINIFHDVAETFNVNFWDDWIEPAGLGHMAHPASNRAKPYSGPKIEDLPVLSGAAKAAILAKINAS